MLPARLLAALAASLLALALLAPAAPARTVKLRDRKSGFTVKAPTGFKLKAKHGIYRVTGRGLRLSYARVPSRGLTPAQTGAELVRAAKATATGVRSSASRWSARAGGQALEVRAKGSKLIVLRYGRTSSHKAQASQSAGQLALLRRIAGTARGGRVAQLPRSIALKSFTAPDGSATAQVPDLPGWNYSGGSGVIEGTGPQGAFAFGVPFYAAVPGSFAASGGSFPTAPFPATAGEGLTNIVPQFFARSGLPGITIRVTGQFPGSDQFLGAGYVSGFLTAAVTNAGHNAQGVFLYGAGTFDTGVDGAYANYLSYAAVNDGTDPRIGAALLRTWATWDPSRDQQRRLNEALNSILTTNVGGGPIDQDVFDEAAAKWDEYFRQ
jgi:hypothetical protein